MKPGGQQQLPLKHVEPSKHKPSDGQLGSKGLGPSKLRGSVQSGPVQSGKQILSSVSLLQTKCPKQSSRGKQGSRVVVISAAVVKSTVVGACVVTSSIVVIMSVVIMGVVSASVVSA